MVSTGTETADATVTGPGFDSQQVHYTSSDESSSFNHSQNASSLSNSRSLIAAFQPGAVSLSSRSP